MRKTPETPARPTLSKHIFRAALLTGLGFAALFLSSAGARADFTLCNPTPDRIAVAIGYHDEYDWVSEGWWNIEGKDCEVLLKGDLTGRFYYIYALDYDSGGSWGGTAIMCTGIRKFTIRGRADCEIRGYRRTGFYEVDTNEERDWVQQLSPPVQTQDRD